MSEKTFLGPVSIYLEDLQDVEVEELEEGTKVKAKMPVELFYSKKEIEESSKIVKDLTAKKAAIESELRKYAMPEVFKPKEEPKEPKDPEEIPPKG